MNNTKPTHIILLPGLDGTGELFAEFIAKLPEHFRCQVIPFSQHGEQTPEALRDFVLDAIPQNEEVILLAESFAGPVAREVVLAKRRNIRALILVASFFSVPRACIRLASYLPLEYLPWHFAPKWALRLLCLGWRASPDRVNHLQRIIRSVRSAVLAQRVRVLSRLQVTRDRVTIPTLYISATADRLVPRYHINDVAALCDEFYHDTITGPHLILQTAPEEAAGVVQGFIKKIQSAQL